MTEPTEFAATGILARDIGEGPIILILHPGMDDGGSWEPVAELLATDHRVITPIRRQYRMDLPGGVSMAEETEDVVRLIEAVDEPVALVGHSSGAVLALETLVTRPEGITSAVLYEPPIDIGHGLGGKATAKAEAAIAAGDSTEAITIFMRDIVGVSEEDVAQAIPMMRGYPPVWNRIPRQIDDTAAIEALGNRLDVYAAIETPILLLGGDQSPAHLAHRLTALERVLPNATGVVMPREGHGANGSAPTEVARIVRAFTR